MIQRDYILRMIEEFMQFLSRLQSLRRGQLWAEAAAALDDEFRRLTGAGAEAVAQFSETELLARLLKGEPTHVVRQKALILTTLLELGIGFYQRLRGHTGAELAGGNLPRQDLDARLADLRRRSAAGASAGA